MPKTSKDHEDSPAIRCLIPVWGSAYIDDYLSLAAPTLLAPGNLPYLAAMFPVEIIFLTCQKDEEKFLNSPTVIEMQKFCLVRFIYVDDLITSTAYGVILTLIYARGINNSGGDPTKYHFMFMNSDFLFAEGSLKIVAKKIAAGEKCISAPSLRVSAEDILPEIESCREISTPHLLVIPSRKMVKMSLKYLHPTVVIKTQTQNKFKSETYNQMYWQVNGSCLLARHYLIFQLVIKPERAMPPVNSYSDYGFAPELVPNARLDILDDSDDFFMMEMQKFRQELELLSLAKSVPSNRSIAGMLSEWVTKEHIEFSKHDIIYHSEDIPSGISDYKKMATARVDEINDLIPEVKNHIHHPYWIGAIYGWLQTRKNHHTGQIDIPPELAGGASVEELKNFISEGSLFSKISAYGLWHFLLTRKHPFMRLWNREWADYYALKKWLLESDLKENNIVIAEEDGSLFKQISKKTSFRFVASSELENGEQETGLTKRIDRLLFYNVPRRTILLIIKTLQNKDILDGESNIAIFLIDFKGGVSVAQYKEMLFIIQDLRNEETEVISSFSGGEIFRSVAWMQKAAVRLFLESNPVWKLIGFPFLSIILMITTLSNIVNVLCKSQYFSGSSSAFFAINNARKRDTHKNETKNSLP